MTISAQGGTWTIPPYRALAIPGTAPAAIDNRFRVAVRSLYFAATLHALPADIRAMEITGFARELLLHVVRHCPLDLAEHLDAALVAVLVDQLHQLPEARLRLTWPIDDRAVLAASLITDDATCDLNHVAHAVGASRRTLERVFSDETGLTLGAWRRRAHILSSLHHLAAGASVTATALATGYTTASAYVSAFHRELGQTPRQFLHL
jgi:AraC-like DNA-binding protein